jgi:Zn-finger nucleic acid-binding protein
MSDIETNEAVKVAICPQCGGVTLIVGTVDGTITREDAAELRAHYDAGDVIETMHRGQVSRLIPCRGHAVETADLFGGGE